MAEETKFTIGEKLMAKSMFTEKQIKAVMDERGIKRPSAIKWLNREHKGGSPAVEPMEEVAPVAEAKKAPKVAAPKSEPKGVSAQGLANRVSGTNRYNVAGRPTREQIELVYGPKSFAMTWPQREAIGVTAEQFQDALKAKLAAETK